LSITSATQSAMQPDGLQSIADDVMQQPHPSAMDAMSNAQIIDAVKNYVSNRCATQLIAHPDVYAVIDK
jgi:hypothetical protein